MRIPDWTPERKPQPQDLVALQQRFETGELVEITAAIATYNMVARFLVALGVTPEAS